MIPGQRTGAHDAAPAAGDGETEAMRHLVRRAQDGDAEAFGELYRIYRDTVFRYVYYRVSTHALAEDLTSETFARALRRITSFAWQGRDFGAWLVTIARNLIADHFKSSRYRMEVCTGEMFDTDETEQSPEVDVLARLQDAAVREAIARLNPDQRACIEHRFLADLSVAATAQELGKNEGAIKTLQYRAVRTLGRLIAADPALADDGAR
jgi:RNA polymerase sigma-70 factor (ECF subfamily)